MCKEKLTNDQESIAASYHDSSTLLMLESFIDNKEELDRLNNHIDAEWWSQELFNKVLRAAIAMRKQDAN